MTIRRIAQLALGLAVVVLANEEQLLRELEKTAAEISAAPQQPAPTLFEVLPIETYDAFEGE